MPTTFANTINSNPIYADRAEKDASGNTIATTYATKGEIPTFTQEQQDAMDSGINSTKVGNYDTHVADTTIHVTSSDKTAWNAKEDAANKAQSIDASSTTDFPSSKATADFVNSSVSTNTAKFLGNFTLTDLSLTYPATDAQIETALDGYAFSPAPTNNDYVYVEIQDPQTPGVTDVVKRFKFDGTNWLYEYSLNNSSFTAAEIAAIDSGVTATKVGNYDTHIADTDIHVTTSDKSTWNAKQDAISDLNTIRSGASAGATAVQPGDLATVASTGDYDDLLNKPTIPTVPVQGVEVDGTSVVNANGIAEITMPTIPVTDVEVDGTSVVNASGVAEITMPTIPVTDVEVDGSSVVNASGVAEITMPTIPVTDVEVDGTSVLNAQGVAEITMPTFTQAQANWAEADNTDPSYIQNKPTLAAVATSGAYSDLSGTPTIPPALSAGNGIDITNNVVSADLDGTSLTNGANGLSVTLPVPDTTGASQGDVLSVGQSGIEWVTPGGGGGDDAVLTYNVSTWSDFTTAYNAGKNIRVVETVDGATHEAVLFEYNPNGSPHGYAKFTATILGTGVGAVSSNWYQIANIDSGIWTRGGGTVQGNFNGQGAIYVNLSSHRISLTLDGSSLTQSSSGLAVANPLPSTLGTAGQVLQVNSGATGVEWATPSGGSVTDVEVDGTSVVSQGVASITMPTELVPTVTSNDDGKVLKASYSGGAGSYSWETESGGGGTQADWTEDDPADPSYIENKPTPKTLTAGTGISITENASTITVTNTAPDLPIGSWEDVSTEAQYNTTPVLAGGFAIKYNAMLKLVSVTADVNLDAGAANIFTWSNRLKPVANAFALGNGLTLYVSQTSLNQPASATNRWVNGVWMWPVVGE